MRCAVCGCPPVRWLRVKTVAGQLGCTARTVRRMVRRGEMVGVRVGRTWRIDHASLDEYLTVCEAGTAQARQGARNFL
ncbi:MAG: excisionase family DNA-binding protein [Candidatus Brocadiaceae bacterium]|nr:excisionase family DNA-binding protein [Candidatus Brocadiaceae bacterium]